MAGTDSYSQGVSVATLTDPPNAEILARNLADGIVPRLVMRFASSSARTAALTGTSAPAAGMVTYLADVKRVDFYDGSVWVPIRGQSAYDLETNGSGTTTSEITSGMAVTLATRAGVAYQLHATGLLRSTVADDRMELRIRRGTTTGATQVGGGSVGANTSNTGYTCVANGVDTPGAGNTTWTVFCARSGGTGTVDMTSSTTLPGSFVVREL
jgi:hypothetical protein